MTAAVLANRSPWVSQLAPDGPARPLTADTDCDVAIVGAGIAGVATAFFALRDTAARVLLVERNRVGRGATGRNAGQLTTYFERPLYSIADEFGTDLAVAAQRALDNSHDLLDLMVAESGATVRVERFTGHMGMRTLNHVQVHLHNNAVRRRGGLATETCVIADTAPFLRDIPPDYADLYDVVSAAEVCDLLETADRGFVGVLSDRKGCANSALLVQQVLAYLGTAFADRFTFHDHTAVDEIRVGAPGAQLAAHGKKVHARRVVLCTNGYTEHRVVDHDGNALQLHPAQRITGTVGYMAAFVEPSPRPPGAFSFIRNAEIGGDTPYIYVTRRTWDSDDDTVTLTCMGGPERPSGHAQNETESFPSEMLAQLDAQARPFASGDRPAGMPYDFQWSGLMGYMPGKVRVIGVDPRYSSLLYNFGCNGVGFLPSVHGAHEIAALLAGADPEPSIFVPRSP